QRKKQFSSGHPTGQYQRSRPQHTLLSRSARGECDFALSFPPHRLLDDCDTGRIQFEGSREEPISPAARRRVLSLSSPAMASPLMNTAARTGKSTISAGTV